MYGNKDVDGGSLAVKGFFEKTILEIYFFHNAFYMEYNKNPSVRINPLYFLFFLVFPLFFFFLADFFFLEAITSNQ